MVYNCSAFSRHLQLESQFRQNGLFVGEASQLICINDDLMP